jgi:hypothetical protein
MKVIGEDFKKEIEEYVDDWHWDEDSEKYAFEMGKFLFSFMDYLDDQNLSERTIKNHRSNIGLIGMFEAGYGYNKEFHPNNLEDGPSYIYEFGRKVSDSKYAIQSYESTWRKLDKYIKSGKYERYLEQVEEKLKKEHRG